MLKNLRFYPCLNKMRKDVCDDWATIKIDSSQKCLKVMKIQTCGFTMVEKIAMYVPQVDGLTNMLSHELQKSYKQSKFIFQLRRRLTLSL